MPNPEHKKMTAMHFYGWEKGLKTGQYYLRSRPARDAIKFTVNVEALIAAVENKVDLAILKALDKVKETPKKVGEKDATQTISVNLGRKAIHPRGGFATEESIKQSDEKKKIKIAEEREKSEEDYNPFECENCGS
jgi:hypothetical protein